MQAISIKGKGLEKLNSLYDKIEEKNVYGIPGYVKLIANYYGYDAEAFVFKQNDIVLFYPYFKRPLSPLKFLESTDNQLSCAYDLISSWYYGGLFVSGLKNVAQEKHLLNDFLQAFGKYCRSNNIVSEFIRFDPNIENHNYIKTYIPVERNRKTVYVDLEISENEIWKNMRGGCRRNIKKAIKHELVIEQSRSRQDIDIFHQIYNEEMKRKAAPWHLYFDLPFFYRLFELENHFVLLTARHKERIIGGFIVAHDQKSAYHYLSASLPEYWEMRVNNLLFYEAIQWAKKGGFKRFDFQGGRDGVFQFKQNFSRTKKDFYVAKVIHMPQLYDELCHQHAAFYKQQYDGAQQIYFPKYRLFEKS
jgi:hypothetical protein